MAKTVKIIGGLIIGLIALVAIGATVVLFVVNPNEYKPQIAALVKDKTGREVSFGGDIKLSLFPWLGVTIGPVAVSNAPGFGNDPFVRLDAADVRVKLLPLLHKQVEIANIKVRSLTANLAKNKQGVTNWQDLLPKETTAEAMPAATSSSTPASTALASLAIGGVNLDNATLNWRDDTTGQQQKIEGLNLTTSAISLDKPFTLGLTFGVKSDKPQIKGHVDLKTQLALDLAKQHYGFDDTTLTVQFDLTEAHTAGTLTMTTSGSADLQAGLIQLASLQVNAQARNAADQSKSSAELSVPIQFNLNSQQLSAAPLSLQLVNESGTTPPQKIALKLKTNINADLKQQTLNVADLLIDAMGIHITGAVKGNKIIDAPNFTGQLAIAPVNARDALTQAQFVLPEMDDSKALTRFDAKVEFSASDKSVELTKLLAHLDDTTITTQAAVKNFAKPAINFAVNVDRIDVDRYLPPKKPDQAQPAGTPATTTAGAAAELPLDMLRALNLNGKVNVGQIKVTNLNAADINVAIAAKDGLIEVQPLGAKLYQGSYTGHVTADARGKVLQVNIDEKVSGVQAGPLLKDLMGDDKLSGTASVNIKATATGNTSDALMKKVNGNGTFSFRNGAVKDVNIGYYLRAAEAKVHGEEMPADKAAVQTDFAELTGSFKITDGLIENPDLLVKSPALRVDGAGTFNLNDMNVDYGVKALLAATAVGQGGRAANELKGIPLPIRITGKVPDIKIKPDYEGMAKARLDAEKDKLKAKAQEKVDTEKQKIKEQASEKLKEKLGGSNDELKKNLKGLFGK